MPRRVSRNNGGRNSSRSGVTVRLDRPRARGQPAGRLRHEAQGHDPQQSGHSAPPEEPAPRVRRDVPDPRDLRKQQDAGVQARADDPGHHGPRHVRPAFRDQRHAVGPHAADAQPHEEAKHEHLLQAADQPSHSRKDRIEKDAHPHGPCAADAVAQRPEHDAAGGGTEHQTRRETGKPIPRQGIREAVCQQTLGDGDGRDRHQAELYAIKEQTAEGGEQDHEPRPL